MNTHKTAVVLFNLGGPDSDKAVEPFLFNLFNDPDIINFPFSFLFRRWLAYTISSKRAPRIIEQYNEIGGKSPIYELTKLQADLLEAELNKEIDAKVFIAMRYWRPYTHQAVEEILKGDFKNVVLLPLYPHYSSSTTGSSYNEWKRATSRFPDLRGKTVLVRNYFDNEDYVDAVINRIDEGLAKFGAEKIKDVFILFSAHGTPMKLVRQGDPYSFEIKKTVNAIVKKRGITKYKLCYQSKVGPQQWLTPATQDVIKETINEGYKDLLVVPIAFVSDHLETLFELGIEYRKEAMNAGAENYIVTEGLNGSPFFIKTLKNLVLKNLE
ncbi:MAG: ferrochelatase [Bacteroidetes bacterium]|nr:ferrochelatase [Bacteroidota bacterium]